MREPIATKTAIIDARQRRGMRPPQDIFYSGVLKKCSKFFPVRL